MTRANESHARVLEDAALLEPYPVARIDLGGVLDHFDSPGEGVRPQARWSLDGVRRQLDRRSLTEVPGPGDEPQHDAVAMSWPVRVVTPGPWPTISTGEPGR